VQGEREHGAALFGRYRRVRELGRGGMGVVLLAHDEVLDLPVALKLVPELVVSDTDGIHDLKKEVLRGMALTHPGIVRVYSFEQDATHAAIIMEYVEGETLADVKARQPGGCFDAEELRPWLEQICAALDYAHTEARIAHRDLKPRNILLDRNGRVKLADFGVSSSLGSTMSRVSVQAAVHVSGTPSYMSPQQARGECPSHLDDIYSLGATLYELITSRPPFFRGNILGQVFEETPPRMSARRAELEVEGKAAIPERWEKLVAACLSKEREARPASGAAILQTLQGGSTTLMAAVAATTKPKLLKHIELSPAHVVPSERPRYQEQTTSCVIPVRGAPTLRRARKEWSLLSAGKKMVAMILAGAVVAGALHGARKWTVKRPAETAATAAAVVSKPSRPASSAHSSLTGAKLQPAGGILVAPERAAQSSHRSAP
jgi:serine/threonine protein kinase